MSDPVAIASIQLSDLTAVTEIHCAAFPKSVLTRLGPEAVRRYYHWQLTGPHKIVALIARSPKQAAGFVFAGVFNGAMSGFLRRNKWYLAWHLLTRPWLFMDELIRAKFKTGWRSLTRPRQARGSAGQARLTSKKPPFTVLAIAVNPASQGHGAAYQLMFAVEDSARRTGSTEMHLTVAPENVRAIRFYERLGWKKTEKDGAWAGNMEKVI